MSETRNERILYKMASEIGNMMKVGIEDIDRIVMHLRGFSSNGVNPVTYNLDRFYKLVAKSAARQKQRRGIGYKIDLILSKNERFIRDSKDPGFVSIKRPTFFSSNKFD